MSFPTLWFIRSNYSFQMRHYTLRRATDGCKKIETVKILKSQFFTGIIHNHRTIFGYSQFFCLATLKSFVIWWSIITHLKALINAYEPKSVQGLVSITYTICHYLLKTPHYTLIFIDRDSCTYDGCITVLFIITSSWFAPSELLVMSRSANLTMVGLLLPAKKQWAAVKT